MIEFYLISLLAVLMSLTLLTAVMRGYSRYGLIILFYPPAFLAVFFVFLFLLPTALAVLFEDALVYRYQSWGYSSSTWMTALIFGFLFVTTALAVAVKITPPHAFERRVIGCRDRIIAARRKQPIDLTYALIFYVLPLISLGYLLMRFGGANYADYMVDRIVARRGLGFIIMPSTWLTISIAAAVFSAISGLKARSTLLISLPMLAFFIYAQLFLGSKSRGLIVIVYIALAWAFFLSSKHRFTVKPLVLIPGIAVVVSVVGLFFGDFREATTRDIDISEVETRVAVTALFSKFNAFGAIENTMWLVENQSFNDLTVGRSFLAVVVGAVPRAIWAGKPVGGGPELRNLIHPGSYDLNSGFQLSSYSPGIIAESYMSFGIAGIIVIAPFFGFLFGLIARFPGSISTPLFLVTYVIVMYRATYMLTGEVFGSVAGMFMTVLPIIFYIGLRRILTTSKRSSRKLPKVNFSMPNAHSRLPMQPDEMAK